MLDIVAITRVFPSLESVADVMFSSPCSRKDRQNAHNNWGACVCLPGSEPFQPADVFARQGLRVPK